MADMVRVDLLAIAKWHAERVDDYVVPFAGMAKRDTAASRERVLSPEELAMVWNAAGDADRFGVVVKLLLLTGQRREKVLTMKRSDVDPVTGKWTIPKQPGDAKQKGHPEWLVLPPVALDLIKAQVRLASSPWIFPAYRGDSHLNGIAELKKAFNAKLPADMSSWTLHDLRRTARTMMTKARVDFYVAEAILGHKLPGVAGIYDRHDFAEEMATALATLAAHIERIVNPPVDNVLPFGPVPVHA
jgi:integrase